jgi:hypothetical protein
MADKLTPSDVKGLFEKLSNWARRAPARFSTERIGHKSTADAKTKILRCP